MSIGMRNVAEPQTGASKNSKCIRILALAAAKFGSMPCGSPHCGRQILHMNISYIFIKLHIGQIQQAKNRQNTHHRASK